MKPGSIIRYSLIILCFLASLGGLAYLGFMPQLSSSAGKCKQVTVSIKSETGGEALFLSPEKVLEELAQRGLQLKGQTLDSINLRRVEQALLRLPIYKQVEAFVSPATSSVQIRLVEKSPLFIVLEASGKSYYVTQGKDTFPIGAAFAAYLPVVSGDVSRDIATGAVYDLLEVVRRDPYFADYFGQVYVDRDQGISLIPRVGTTRVILGHSGDWAGKLRKWRIFAESVLPQRGMNAYAYVNLDYGDQIVAGARYPVQGHELDEDEPTVVAPRPAAPSSAPKPAAKPEAQTKKSEPKKVEKKPEVKRAPEKKVEPKKPVKEKPSPAKTAKKPSSKSTPSPSPKKK